MACLEAMTAFSCLNEYALAREEFTSPRPATFGLKSNRFARLEPRLRYHDPGRPTGAVEFVIEVAGHRYRLLAAEPADRPFPFTLVGERQLNIREALARQFQPEGPDLAPCAPTAHPAPKPRPRLGKVVIPALAVEPPPHAMRIESRTMAARANHLDRVLPCYRLKEGRGDLDAIFAPAAHVTALAEAGRGPARRHSPRRSLRESRVPVRWRHRPVVVRSAQ